MILFSNSFGNGEEIPMKYTADGENISPHIGWKNIPKKTRSLALVMYDIPFRSIPSFNIKHWILYNIPLKLTEVAEGFPSGPLQENGICQGISYFGNKYGGPDPPFGEHTYYFNLYAIDEIIDLDPKKTKWKKLYNEMKNHIIEQSVLAGKYKKDSK
ncbi:MAG: YbhB/YbcL family Raf kinase inhibitor-like protein [Candidatus Methanofastidiosa archaeon]|jgi:Raf kinase inhibitor-like YbhB/YbcL family protein|nr:YbhB/YbcL family Raf kinase inhibitor-like protein [Candidatus Methanofastidiosa archaeon]